MNTKFALLFRQGDVLLARLTNTVIPEGAKEQPPVAGDRVVLAYGEVTGHAHAIRANEAKEYTLEDAGKDARRYIESLGAFAAAPFNILETRDNAFGKMFMLDTPAGPTLFSEVDVDVADTVATPKDAFSRLTHEEHGAQALLKGLYEKTTAQREYAPEGLRNVAD